MSSFNFEGEELIYEVSKTGDSEFLKALGICPHTFDHPENFAYCDGSVRILDYGERGFENLLKKHGKKIEQLLLSRVKRSA